MENLPVEVVFGVGLADAFSEDAEVAFASEDEAEAVVPFCGVFFSVVEELAEALLVLLLEAVEAEEAPLLSLAEDVRPSTSSAYCCRISR